MQSPLRVNAIYVLGVACTFSLVSICARLSYDSGSNPLTVLAVRTLFVGIVLCALLKMRRISWRLLPRERNWALILGIVLALTTFSLNKSIELIPVSIAILIFYTYPMLTSIMSWVTGKEQFSLRVATTLVIAFFGLTMALQVKGGPLIATGLLFAFAASIGQAALTFLTGRAFRGLDSRPRSLHMLLSASVMFLLICAITGGVALPSGQKGWIGFVCGPFAYSFAIIGFFVAVSAMGALKASFYMNFEPVGTIFFSALILGQFMTVKQLAGAGLVIVALLAFRMPAVKGV